MTARSSTTYYPVAPSWTRWLTIGFIAGCAAVLIFHQGAVALMNALELTERAPYSMQPTQPFGVPQLSSLTFWGGVWGVFFAVLLQRLYGAPLVVISLVLGAVLPTLVAWYLVASLKGQPVAAGYVPMGMAFGIIVNAAWGLGTGLGLAMFGRRRISFERRRKLIDRRSRMERRERGDMQGDAA